MIKILASVRDNKKTSNRFVLLLSNHPKTVLVFIVVLSFFIIYFPFVFLGKPFIYSDVGADTENVYYPFFNLLFNKIKTGDFSFWTFNYGLGTNTLTRQADALSIFTYLTLIFGKTNIKYSLIWVHLLKIVLCGVLSYKYFSYFKFSTVAKMIGAYLYAFNGFIMLWGQHYFFGTASVCIILLLVAIEDTLKKKKCTCYIALATANVLIISYYIAYMTLALAFIYLFLRLLYICFTEKKFRFKNITWILFSFLFAFLLSAFAFWPSVTVLMQQSNRVSSSGLFSSIFNNAFLLSDSSIILTGLLRLFSNNLMGIFEYSGAINYYEAPQYFMSSLNVFVFTILFFESVLSLRKDRIKSILVLISELLIVYSVLFRLIPLAFNGFVYEAYRYTFVLMPIFALGYAEVFNKIFLGKLRYAKLEIILSAGISLSILSVSYLLYGSRSNKSIATLLVCVLICSFVSLISVCCFNPEAIRRGKVLCTVLIAMALIFNVCFDGYITATKRVISAEINPQNYTGHESDSVIKAISKLEDSDLSFYRIEKTFYTVSCLASDSMIEGYSGISAYDSIENKYVQEFIDNVCPEMIFGPATFYHRFINDMYNSDVNSVLGVKYVLSKSENEYDGSDAFVLYDRVYDLYVYKNINSDSIARVYYNVARQPEDFSNSKINIMDTLIINDENIEEISSGKSSIKVSSVYKDKNDSSHIHGTVQSENNGYLFLAIPYSVDWKAFIDGKQVEIMRADYGFMALKIDKGSHSIELKYGTPKLALGITVSVCSAFLLLIFILLRRIFIARAQSKKVNIK